MQFYNAADGLFQPSSPSPSGGHGGGLGTDLHAAAAAARVEAVAIEDISHRPAGVLVVCISDTHGRHGQIAHIPAGDVLIHAGDFSDTGHSKGIRDFVDWMDSLPHKQKIFIAGNHDTTLHTEYYVNRGAERFHPRPERREGMEPAAYSELCREAVRSSRTCTYLEDSTTHIEDVSSGEDSCTNLVYGSPWQPEFCDWAFNLDRGQPCASTWEKIPLETDVLITHGPPLGYGDRTQSGFRCGCEDMSNILEHRLRKPRVHIFGHIHEDCGKRELKKLHTQKNN